MNLEVIGTGVGRTGTYSLKLALAELGFGPCYHMEEVILQMPKHLPLWQTAVAGNPDFGAIYHSYGSAVDWPTAGFYKELLRAYPDAKYVLTVRNAAKWAESFGETIQALLKGKAQAPEPMHPWLDMAERVVEKTGFSVDADPAELERQFEAHRQAVQAVIPPEQLLVFDVKQGWEPLCRFLNRPVPNAPFPRSNHREEFWEKVKGAA